MAENSRRHVRTRPQPPPSAWLDGFRRRVRLARLDRSMSLAQAGALLGKNGTHAVSKIESGGRRHVTVRVAIALCRALHLSLRQLLDGWPGWSEGSPLPARGTEPIPVDEHETLDAWSRLNLRRLRGDRGTPAVAKATGVPQSTLVRWESGQYRNIDLAQLERVAAHLGVPLVAMFDPPVESPADEPRQERPGAA